MPGYDKETSPTENAFPVNDPFVQLENVSKRFDSIDAVQNVNLQVEKGTIFGFVGSDRSIRGLNLYLSPKSPTILRLGSPPFPVIVGRQA